MLMKLRIGCLALLSLSLIALAPTVGLAQAADAPIPSQTDPLSSATSAQPAQQASGPPTQSPTRTLAEIDYRQVVATLESPLLDEFNEYRSDGVSYVDGFAGYLLKKAKHRHLTGTVLYKVGMTLLIMGAGAAIAGVSWMISDVSNDRYVHIGAAASSICGGGLILISLPFVIVGSVVRQKGKKWVTSLEALIKYRHSVPIEVWAARPTP